MYFRSSPADSRIQTCGQDCRDQKSLATADWETVMACLAELGFHAQGDRPPAAAEVVLAAQLRLRYWRRQLPCGRLGITDEPDMSGDFVGVRAGDLPAGRRGAMRGQRLSRSPPGRPRLQPRHLSASESGRSNLLATACWPVTVKG